MNLLSLQRQCAPHGFHAVKEKNSFTPSSPRRAALERANKPLHHSRMWGMELFPTHRKAAHGRFGTVVLTHIENPGAKRERTKSTEQPTQV